MKAITVKQPWSSLIVHGIKDIENRTWACPKKYIGQRVLIHASKAKPAKNWGELSSEQRNIASNSPMFGTGISELPFGSIIGSVEIVGCVINYPSIWAEKTGIPMLGDVLEDIRFLGRAIPPDRIIYNWVLANPVLFEKPIPAKGRLSFWDYTGVIEEGGKP